MSTIASDDEIGRTEELALSDDPVDEAMHRSPMTDDLINAGDNYDTISQIARREIKDWIAQEVDRVYAECS